MSSFPVIPSITAREVSNWQTPTLGTQLTTPFWYAVHTASRHEKQVSTQLLSKSVETFAPLYGCVRRWKTGKTWVELPLFPGYLFVRLALNDKLRVLSVPGVVGLVGFRNRPIPLPEYEIEWLKNGLSNYSAQPHPYLRVGERVRITKGPLSGAEGILVRLKQDFRVVISMELIMRSVSVEIDRCDLELVGSTN